MLSSTARPKLSGPASWPSSKTIAIDLTTLPGGMAGNGRASSVAVQRKRTQPGPLVKSAGGELQPTKWLTPLVVTTLNRGAPAPQCDPLRSTGLIGLRRSYPSSLSVIPFTPFTSAPADALVVVEPVFTSKSP